MVSVTVCVQYTNSEDVWGVNLFCNIFIYIYIRGFHELKQMHQIFIDNKLEAFYFFICFTPQ